jgi:hypothetical protein
MSDPIQIVSDYIVARLRRIKLDGVPITVYEPDAERPQGETVYPHLAVSLVGEMKCAELNPEHEEVFVPSAETRTISVPEHLACRLRACVIGSKQEPYQIVEGTSDQLLLRVGLPSGWVPTGYLTSPPDQPVTLIVQLDLAKNDRPLDAWEVARHIATWTTGIQADVWDGRLRLKPTSPGVDLEILECEHSAYEVLGLTPGIYRHTEQVGPVSYTVKPAATPWKLLYQVDRQAVSKEHAKALDSFIMDCFPRGHWPVLGPNLAPIWSPVEPKNLDELAKPEWWTAFRWWVGPVPIDRKTSYQVKSIGSVTMEWAGLESR